MFGTTTLILTDFASKVTLPKPNGIESLTPDGSSLHNSSQNDYNDICHYAVNAQVPSSHQYNSLKPAQKKQKIDYSSSSVEPIVESLTRRFVISRSKQDFL